MMLPCDKCLENRWSFKVENDWVTATCTLCENIVEFPARKEKPKKQMEDGSECRKCDGKVELRVSKFRAKKMYKAYYYTHVFRCSKCKTLYMDDRFKIINKNLSTP